MKLNHLLSKTQLLKQENNTLVFNNQQAKELLEQYGSPLYIYLEDVFRKCCQDMKNLVTYPHFKVSYAVKANNNINLLKIAREEGLSVDAISPGEIFLEQTAGFDTSEIFFVSNNVDVSEFRFAMERGIQISVDSLSQLDLFGRNFPGSKIAVRINPGIGDGHHAKVITAGDKTKFGIHATELQEIKNIAAKYNLSINGVNMHVGSNFLTIDNFITASKVLLSNAEMFIDTLEFVDIGGGIGISYKDGQEVDLKLLGQTLDELFYAFSKKHNKMVTFCIEPGRYVCAQSAILLATVHSIKTTPFTTFVGTDAGFNVLMRPMTYDSYHEILNCNNVRGEQTPVSICGNICETGDLLAKDRELTATKEGDVLAVLDAGAYGYSMASNYNARLRPAEVLLKNDGRTKLIRRRDTLADILANQIVE